MAARTPRRASSVRNGSGSTSSASRHRAPAATSMPARDRGQRRRRRRRRPPAIHRRRRRHRAGSPSRTPRDLDPDRAGLTLGCDRRSPRDERPSPRRRDRGRAAGRDSVAPGNARCSSTGSASAPRPQSRAPIGSGNHTAPAPDPPSASTQPPSRHSRPVPRRAARRRCWAHAGPPAPTIAHVDSSTSSKRRRGVAGQHAGQPGRERRRRRRPSRRARGASASRPSSAVDLVAIVRARHHVTGPARAMARAPSTCVPAPAGQDDDVGTDGRRRGPSARPRRPSGSRPPVEPLAVGADRTTTVADLGGLDERPRDPGTRPRPAPTTPTQPQLARRHASLSGARRPTAPASRRAGAACPRCPGAAGSPRPSPARTAPRRSSQPAVMVPLPAPSGPGSGQWG